jgi:hypothetical protein
LGQQRDILGPAGLAGLPGLAGDLAAACEAAERAAGSLRLAGGYSREEADAVIDRCVEVGRLLPGLITLLGAGRARGELDRALGELPPGRRRLAAAAARAGAAFERAQAPGATEADAEAGARALAELLRLAGPGGGPGRG